MGFGNARREILKKSLAVPSHGSSKRLADSLAADTEASFDLWTIVPLWVCTSDGRPQLQWLPQLRGTRVLRGLGITQVCLQGGKFCVKLLELITSGLAVAFHSEIRKPDNRKQHDCDCHSP
jgi:hypothetical protein